MVSSDSGSCLAKKYMATMSTVASQFAGRGHQEGAGLHHGPTEGAKELLKHQMCFPKPGKTMKKYEKL